MKLAQIPALDGLRGVAILLVLPHNLRRIFEPFDSVSLLWVQLADRGWIGVQLFFVLSGFLITRILLSTQGARNYYSGFYARRALRILPLYYAALILWLLVLPWFRPGMAHDTHYDIYLWFFLSNWVSPFHPSGNGLAHFWSLAVEEQFYLFWPVALRRITARQTLWLCGVVAVLSVGLRVGMLLTGWSTEAVYEFTPCRMDALALGGAAAAVLAVPELRSRMVSLGVWLWWSPLLVFVTGAAVSRGYRQTGVLAQTAGYSLLAGAVALWILSVCLTPPGGHWLEWRFLRTAGKYSYGLYVIHFPFGSIWGQLLVGAGWPAKTSVAADLAQLAAVTGVVFLLAFLSYRWLEEPFLRQKGRYEPDFAA